MYVIAEIGTNHNGNPDLAIKMALSAARDCGVQAVKMQLFEADHLVDKQAATLDHANKSHGSQYLRMRDLELPDETYQEIKQICVSSKVDFIISPFATHLVEKAVRLGADKLKVASGELTNVDLLIQVKAMDMPTQLATGMATDEEIAHAVDILHPDVLMHCVSLYPTLPWQADLGRIKRLWSTFPDQYIGYSDHTVGEVACYAAAAIGARFIEKHFTISMSHTCADQGLSLDPYAMRRLTMNLRKIEDMMKKSTYEDHKMRVHLRRGPNGLRGSYGS